MPVTPQQAREALHEDLRQPYKEICDTIDDLLLKGERSIGIAKLPLTHLPYQHAKIIKDRLLADYTKAGWIVSYQSDQREGETWFEFRDPNRKPNYTI